jgi:hypothetical protein
MARRACPARVLVQFNKEARMSARHTVVLLGLFAVGCDSTPAPATQTSPAPPAAAPAAAKGPVAPPTTDEGMIASAMSAAPEAVARNATIVAMNDKMEMRTLRQGSNGWTCLPDMPTSPGADPMCLDKNGMEWAGAWMAHKDPPQDKMGFGYMLVGGSDASNTDPFATKPAPSGQWVDTGPHVMIFNIGTRFDGYPTTPGDAKSPYVMFPNTPYAHLMIPVK